MKSILMKEIERYFRPEFINRLDDVIVFRPLSKEDLQSIVDFETAKLRDRMIDQGWHLELDTSAREFLIDKGYHPDFGARPLRRAISQYMEDPLSESLLSGEFQGKNKILVSRKGEEELLVFESVDDPELRKKEEPADEPVKAGSAEST